jgi:hypothetical protein
MKALTVAVLLASGMLGGCGSDNSTTQGPQINATWTWTPPATKCADIVGATQVSILATLSPSMTAYEGLVACSANAGTLLLPVTGTYVVVLSLLDGSGAALESSVPVTLDVLGPVGVTTAF